ncbi:MerR family transcriptional regulator [Streptantibioticus cattleyicolor]|uniref:Transcriptional regulator, MerR family n=1 Tax=Streptantibioticus cattleyicolor (strain ATCC 35852 / DSM 46488 / JCM 4925 / NBRC 14057 / NRRL 8057) TaxID=1003195 RepID=F8JLT5_STREN|nr:MerR family transcriptional regulator [Streptantibioticus cattleyicolor]AEW99479.1 transcriptional regulator, MerR family [Streptantibioticus cattleyicolor NRRL 8057 = DSM 46488]CCB71479.1 MerR-family transcriptional regulator [Streptantibioticus cattleyicolor NRRL 8057 = DSM 46488]
MRIGELAGLVGVTTRAVRHYHRIGLLAEPARQPNGYREYSLRDAVELARIRRLTELGLSLEEVRDVLAEDADKELAEVLAELDADLARQEEDIRQRRARLAQLLGQAGAGGALPAQAPVSPELAALFDEMARVAARLPGPEPAMAARERELLALLETGSPGGDRTWLDGLTAALRSHPDAVTRAYAVYAQLDELADVPEDDPRVERTARAIVGSIPDEVLSALAPPATEDVDDQAGGGFAEAFLADFAPAQAAAVTSAMRLLRERNR